MSHIQERRYRVREVARLLDFHPQTIWREIWRGNLGCYKIGAGNRVYVGESHLQSYLEKQENKAA
ncbi:MAG: helix-turn-helix domain-containing protein [Pyrinomonadaceae bacterium]